MEVTTPNPVRKWSAWLAHKVCMVMWDKTAPIITSKGLKGAHLKSPQVNEEALRGQHQGRAPVPYLGNLQHW